MAAARDPWTAASQAALWAAESQEKSRLESGSPDRAPAVGAAPSNQPDARPFLVATRRGATARGQQLRKMRQRMDREEVSDPGQFNEVRAYRRIASSFAQAKR